MIDRQQDLTSYILALLTDDEASWCGACGAGESPSSPTPLGPAPLRDLRLFGDCELAVLAASREEYDAHAKLVRAEYSKLTTNNYVELRVKVAPASPRRRSFLSGVAPVAAAEVHRWQLLQVLNQFSQIPNLYHTPEFAGLEGAARENIEREICTLREHLLTGRQEPK